jgi:DNA-binding LacI/PurR family transcriptional regulator
MAQAAEHSGYHLLCFPRSIDQEESLKSYRELIATNRVDGFIVSGVDYNDSRIQLLQELDFPFVAFGRSNPEWDFPYVDLDGAGGLCMVTEHFIGLGHTRIATLAWPYGSRVGEDRLYGYCRAMQGAGLRIHPQWVKRGEGRFHFARKATHELLELPASERPTAIIAFEDPMAIGAMEAIQDRGLKVGGDIAVSGFDDSPMVEYLAPPLTSVCQPAWEIGQRVIQMLAVLLEGETLNERHILVQPELVVRASSGHSLLTRQ